MTADSEDDQSTIDAFAEALGGETIHVTDRKGALPALEAMGLGHWFAMRQARLRAERRSRQEAETHEEEAV